MRRNRNVFTPLEIKSAGFTLVEIMIVVAIIATLATIAILSMLRARLNANEVTAIAGCRTIATGAQDYYVNAMPHSYPSSLGELSASTPPYVDSVLANGTRQGYLYTYSLEDAESFDLNADPVTPGKTGERYFFVDETGVVKANKQQQATTNDPPVE